MISQTRMTISTRGRGTYDLSDDIAGAVRESHVRLGLCHVFVHHTSASLILCENADPTVRGDLEAFLARLVPDGDRRFQHNDEGPDDMPAHIRSILTKMDLTIPVANGHCDLGTWQGVYLYEHRTHGHHRRITITIIGE